MLHIREKAIKELRSLPLRTYDVHVHGSTNAHEPPHFEEVPALYTDYLAWLNTKIEKVQATDREGGVLRFAAEAHTKLVSQSPCLGRCTANSTKCRLKPFRVPSTCELLAMRWTETPQNFENLLNGLLRAAEDAYMTAVHGKPGPTNVATFAQFLATIQAITPPPRYIVVNQLEEDALRFNRAALINIGALEAERVGCDYMAIHDVDMVKAHFGATAMDAALAQL
ncbi:hypothetical protein niasHT_001031 [Heterodera trifolii]|uniref:Uncharacterized protein n=1 Tax=Heterodera trifolii TaxID=157864 RepID=A0ABD2LTU2_9BILA